jgi:hypothetical protein
VAGATDGLTSGGNHLCSGEPHQRRRPPQHRRQRLPVHQCRTGERRPPQRARKEVLAPVLTAGVRTRPSKNAAASPTVYDVLYDPSGRPATREKPWVWPTYARRDRRSCGGRAATPRPSGRRQRQRRHQSPPGPHVMQPARRSLGAEKSHRHSRQCHDSSGPSRKTEKISFQNQCGDSRHPAHGPAVRAKCESHWPVNRENRHGRRRDHRRAGSNCINRRAGAAGQPPIRL